jgi:transposase
MAQNFHACDREQELLLPPSLREWLPAGHLAWFVINAVAGMELSAFYVAYRDDGHGRAAHDPAMMVALLLYAYALGRRSSRAIERACVDDVAFRVIAANQRPDHCTIARFRQRHEAALAAPVLGDAGALRGCRSTRRGGARPRRHEAARERLAAPEPRLRRDRPRVPARGGRGRPCRGRALGERRGDELPLELSTAPDRRGWLRDARRRLDERRAAEARPIPKSRPARLREGQRRLEEEHQVHRRANQAYDAYRARGVMKDGRPFGKRPTPYQPRRGRRARSTSPIPTRATSRPRAAPCRATTPRPSATRTSS